MCGNKIWNKIKIDYARTLARDKFKFRIEP